MDCKKEFDKMLEGAINRLYAHLYKDKEDLTLRTDFLILLDAVSAWYGKKNYHKETTK